MIFKKKMKLVTAVLVGILISASGAFGTDKMVNAQKVEFNETTFPDATIRKAVKGFAFVDDDCKSYIDTDDINYLEIEDPIKDISCLNSFVNLGSLKMEHFEGTDISLKNELLSELVVGADSEELSIDAPHMTSLKINNSGKLKKIDITKADQLVFLELLYNYLFFDINGILTLSKIESLDVKNYPGENYDLTPFKSLTKLSLDSGNLTAIDLGGLKNLTGLEVNKTNISSIDASQNDRLKWISCESCQSLSEFKAGSNIDSIEMDNCGFKSLDLSRYKKLTDLRLNGNKLTKLNFSNCKKLGIISVNDNRLTKLDVSKCKELSFLSAENNRFKTVDLRKCKELYEIDLSHNRKLTKIDISNNKKLYRVDISHTNIKNINTSKNKSLTELYFDNTKISKVDFSKNKKLYCISYYNSKLKKFDLSKIKGELVIQVYYTAKRGGKIKLKNFIPKGYSLYCKSDYVKYDSKKREITVSKNIPKKEDLSNLGEDEYESEYKNQFVSLCGKNSKANIDINIILK